MPFTFAHPAIILPLHRVKYFSLSALVIGSIAPDFVYFIQMKLSGRYSHSIEGAFTLDLPLSLMLALIFHQIVKAPLVNHLPHYFRGRLQPVLKVDFPPMKPSSWLAFIASASIGIVSHLIWDSFTHKETLLLAPNPWLLVNVQLLFLPEAPLFQYLQHISTLLGSAYVVWFFHQMKPHLYQKNAVYNNWPYWLWVAFIASIVLVLRAFLGLDKLGDMVVSIIFALFLGLVGAGLAKKSRLF